RYVFEIVDYLCRFQKNEAKVQQHFETNAQPYGPSFLSIESAKFIVSNSNEPQFGISKVSKIWEKYKASAPYVYALYPFVVGRAVPTEAQVIGRLRLLTKDARRMSRIIGVAAFAADVLAGHARNVRTRDFVHVVRLVPRVRSFDSDELDIIM